jgi:hypothetical protein
MKYLQMRLKEDNKITIDLNALDVHVQTDNNNNVKLTSTLFGLKKGREYLNTLLKKEYTKEAVCSS